VPTLQERFDAIDARTDLNDNEKAIAKTTAQHDDNQRHAGMRNEINNVKELRTSDIASIEDTGVPIAELNYNRVAKALGPDEANEWQRDRNIAQQYWALTGDFYRLPSSEINARMEQLRALGAGQAGFVQRQRLTNQAEVKAQKLEDFRLKYPADAVAKFPEVIAAAKGVDINNPSTMRPLVEARIKAMIAIDQPLDLQVPITINEARTLYAPIAEALQRGDEKALYNVENGVVHGRVRQLIETVDAGWGGYAPAALGMIMGVGHANQNTKELLYTVMKKLGNGETPTQQENRALDNATISGAAKSATSGLTPPPAETRSYQVPDAGAIQLLRQNPQNAPAYDAVYGPGAAARVIGTAAPTAASPQTAPTAPPTAAPPQTYRAWMQRLSTHCERLQSAAAFDATFGQGLLRVLLRRSRLGPCAGMTIQP
jgi:hypothetical protein